MEALWPFGVPKVKSSIPEVAIRPVGRAEVDIVALNIWYELV